MRILVVEDHPGLRKMIRGHLESRGFAVDAVGRADEAGAALAVTPYDLMVLDLGLPDADGTAVLREGRRSSGGRLPVIIVTARDALSDRLQLLNAGADDFILKPVNLLELEARLRAVLRRPGIRADNRLQCGDLSIEPGTGDVQVNGVRIELPRREFALLEELMRARERTVLRGKLEERLYAFDDPVSSNALEKSVSRLRRHLGRAGSAMVLLTKRGIGYRLASPASAAAERSA
jgi:DNA-binding response OmpR family regulator